MYTLHIHPLVDTDGMVARGQSELKYKHARANKTCTQIADKAAISRQKGIRNINRTKANTHLNTTKRL